MSDKGGKAKGGKLERLSALSDAINKVVQIRLPSMSKWQFIDDERDYVNYTTEQLEEYKADNAKIDRAKADLADLREKYKKAQFDLSEEESIQLGQLICRLPPVFLPHWTAPKNIPDALGEMQEMADRLRYRIETQKQTEPSPDQVNNTETDNRAKVFFSTEFKRIDSGRMTVKLRLRYLTEALRFLYEHKEDGWLEWQAVVDAAGNPTSWNGRPPKEHLHGRRQGDKQKIIEAIIEQRGSNMKGWKVKLSDKYQFIVQ